jgi:hypothetical protein
MLRQAPHLEVVVENDRGPAVQGLEFLAGFEFGQYLFFIVLV